MSEDDEDVMEIEIVDPPSKSEDVVDENEENEEMDADTSLMMLCCGRGCSKSARSDIECRTCRVLMVGRNSFCSEACLNLHINLAHDEEDVKKCATMPIPATPSPQKLENKEDDVVVISPSMYSQMEEEEEEENIHPRDRGRKKDPTPAMALREAFENMKLETSGCCPENVSKSKCTRWIKGVRVQFPHTKPHKNQMFLMIQTIDALINRGHAALESPTGTGKTAALLCAALAWHSTFEEKRMKLIEAARAKEEEEEQQPSPSSTGLTQPINQLTASNGKKKKRKKKKRKKKRQSDENIAKRHLPPGYLTKESKPCRIFYGTRTQAQVKNVVREIKALAYSPDLAVLGSRQFLCACKDELKEKSPSGLPLGIACMQRVRKKSSSTLDGVVDDESSKVNNEEEDNEGGCQYVVFEREAREYE